MTQRDELRLVECLEELHRKQGEIAGNEDVTECILRYEKDWEVELTPAELVRCIRIAGENFVDSAQENVHQSVNRYTPDEMQSELERFEAMRPSVRRRAWIMRNLPCNG